MPVQMFLCNLKVNFIGANGSSLDLVFDVDDIRELNHGLHLFLILCFYNGHVCQQDG